jgi:hypothetical protein
MTDIHIAEIGRNLEDIDAANDRQHREAYQNYAI